MAGHMDVFLDLPAGDFFKPVLDDAKQAWQRAAPAVRWGGRWARRALPLVGFAVTAAGTYAAFYDWARLIEGLLPSGAWRFCCAAPFFPRSSYTGRSGWDYGSGGSCPNNGATLCIGAQADTTPFKPFAVGDRQRTYKHEYEVSPGLYRYDHVMRHYIPSGAVAAPVLPQAPPRNPAWFVPGFLVPAAQAGNTGVVGAPPIAPPWPAIPRIKPLPGSAQTRQGGYSPNETDWGVAKPIVVGIDGRGNGVVRPAPIPIATPRPMPNETKVKLDAKTRNAFRLMALYSEANDFIDVFWRALPRAVQRRYRNSSYGRFRAVVENMDQINWAALPALIALNELGDTTNATRLGVARDISNRIDRTGTLWRAWQSFGY